ncbi:DNA methyltransferase [Opitutaceae bacterium TAV5]|nr:DNA methyltransferase [Opitutaceae bacterium TAV5]
MKLVRPSGSDVAIVEITGGRKNSEPASVRIVFPGGHVEVTRATDEDRPAYWVHTYVNRPESVGHIPGETETARFVAAFLREHGVEFDGEFARVGDYVIVDIGMRMLRPRELYRAQGFPENYIIDRGLDEDPETGRLTEIKLTGTAQVRMCGNSVCPPMAEALVRANLPEMIEEEIAA